MSHTDRDLELSMQKSIHQCLELNPSGVNGIFDRLSHSGRSMALGSTQPLT